MKRREFICNTAMLGTTASLWSSASAGASPLDQRGRQAGSPRDDADRSADRDPLAVLRSTLVVDGQDQFVPGYDGAVRIFREGGVDCVQATVGGVQSFADVYNFIDTRKSEVRVARSVAEIRQARQDGRLALVLGWQSARHLQLDPENPISGPPKTPLRAYYEMGLRLSMFTYNVANMFAGGNVGEDWKIGLTNAGRRLLEEFHKLGIIADVGGHSSEQTAFDAIAMSGGIPVVCSHTNVRALNDHVRAISDRLIEAIAGTGGVIGLTAVNDFLARNPSNSGVPITPPVPLDRL
ncbi:MAG: dipeptidase, partial [Steroidobacteraceae bacterium]